MPASPVVIVSNWIAFLSLTASYLGLLVFALKYKGPSGKESYYNGYREQNMLGVFINLFCAVAYFAKVIASHSDDDGFRAFTTIKYVDYLTTCPLLTLDLLWNLEAPYKASSASLVLVCLTFAVATDSAPEPANYVWFGTGLSFFIFSYTFILTIVKERLSFFQSCARGSNAKKSIGYLKVAMFSYFGIWVFFPVLWVLGPKGIAIITDDIQHVFHCILDVIAKSCYGFALLYFKVFFDKKLAASGVDEEEFQKFSKEVTKHMDDDDDRRKRKQEIHLPTVHSATTSPAVNFSKYRGPSKEPSVDGRDDDMEMRLSAIPPLRHSPRQKPTTSFSSRGGPQRTPSGTGFLHSARRASQEGDTIYSLTSPPELQGGEVESMPKMNAQTAVLDDPETSEDEAAFVERARRQYELQKSRSKRRA
mmetsp:Transcript_1896/g.3418  ORF Transcript_1896/g.3418 Transcript_1896/m.3418 type:complete len:420 (+) Transcript_1896:47-1306(+)